MCALFPCILQVGRQRQLEPLSLFCVDYAYHFAVFTNITYIFNLKIRACISRFKDCPLCGADIEKIEADMNLQNTVDRFIEGHGRIKRPHVNTDSEEAVGDNKTVIYEDVSLERGAFLVQHAMRVGLSLDVIFIYYF